MPLKNVKKQCKETSKLSGKRCKNPAVKGYDVINECPHSRGKIGSTLKIMDVEYGF